MLFAVYQLQRSAVDVSQYGTVVQVCMFLLILTPSSTSAKKKNSTEHAKQGWRSHKSVCKSLRGAEWVAIPFTNNLPGSDPDTIMTTASIRGNQNIQASRLDGGMRHESDVAPPNPHGSQPFILKVQTSLSSLPAMLIYDEERALESHVFSSLSPPDAWNKVHSTIRAKGVRGGIKLYFWARRHGDNEVAVAVDRLPEQNFPW